MRRRAAVCAAVVPLVFGVTGCSSAERQPATQAAEEFYAAVQSGQGARACALLVPRAAEGLATGGDTCDKAILELALPGGAVTGVEVWGDEAQVRLARDTVFLHRFPKGWLVRGAGCVPRVDQPYRCELEG